MSTSQDISELIDATCQQIWTDAVNDKDFELLQQKAAVLSAQLAVHRALHTTLTRLNRRQKLSELRIEKSLEAFFGKSNSMHQRYDKRWQQIRELDLESLLLIAASYSPLDITKLKQTEFDYLVENVGAYQQEKDFPARWIFCQEIQVAIAANSNLSSLLELKKKYHNLEFQSSEEESPRKRRRMGGPPGADTTLLLTEAGAKIILTSVQSGVGDGLILRLPKRGEWLPSMNIPHHICADILRDHVLESQANLPTSSMEKADLGKEPT